MKLIPIIKNVVWYHFVGTVAIVVYKTLKDKLK